MASQTCIIISGATATGKTELSLELAAKYQTAIISADSRQCFRELNIGVAKPTAAQLKRTPHYFINSHSILEEVNVKIFEAYAIKAVEKIFAEHDTAIMVGGTGLYIKAFAEGLDDIPVPDKAILHKINAQYQQSGIAWLQQALRHEDPLFFSDGEVKNPQRMMHALAVMRTTGRSILSYHSGQKIQRPFRIQHRCLQLPREQLYKRINGRVEKMMEAGLLEEVRALTSFKNLNALQTVGYRELFEFMDGKISLEKAVELIKQNTRHYAKRQITWFKKNIPTDSFENVTA